MSRIFCCTRGSFNSRWPAGSRLITLRMRKPSGVGMTGETPPCGRETTALRNSGVTRSRSLCIPEYKVDLQKLIGMLVEDKHNNPSNYSLAILSEGAEWEGYQVKEYGDADAFGHRKKMSVAEDLSNEIKAATGEETIVSDLTYDLRSGSPDFVDRMVASTFAGMALDAIEAGKHGLMCAITNGCYAMVPIPDPKLGPRHVEVATMYSWVGLRGG